MPHTNESWFLYFNSKPGRPFGSRDTARIQTTTGALIMQMSPPDGGGRRHDEETALAADFEDNARLAGAARQMFAALKQLRTAALAAGLPLDAPEIRFADEALESADPPRKDVLQDGRRVFTGTSNECFNYLMRVQGQSVDWAVTHGGYAIVPHVPAAEQEAVADEDSVPAGPKF